MLTSQVIKIVQFLSKGGWVMVPILLGSVLGLCLFIERPPFDLRIVI